MKVRWLAAWSCLIAAMAFAVAACGDDNGGGGGGSKSGGSTLTIYSSLPLQGDSRPQSEDITRGIKAILSVCRRKAPRATIVLMGITPRNDQMSFMPIINGVNQNIAKLADGKKVRYLNINDKLADEEGKLREGMTAGDGLHLDVKGYQVWADALRPVLTKLLGPPAKEDHAPPPTGDPSAKTRTSPVPG